MLHSATALEVRFEQELQDTKERQELQALVDKLDPEEVRIATEFLANLLLETLISPHSPSH